MNSMPKRARGVHTWRQSLTTKAGYAFLAVTVALTMFAIQPEANHIGEEIPQVAHHICNSCEFFTSEAHVHDIRLASS